MLTILQMGGKRQLRSVQASQPAAKRRAVKGSKRGNKEPRGKSSSLLYFADVAQPRSLRGSEIEGIIQITG
jgi:hypothetical protein